MKHMNAVAVFKKGKSNFHKINPRDYWIEEKLQGIRAFMSINIFGKVKFVSRGGHDITRLLPHITNFKFPASVYGLTFDGELYDNTMTDNQLAGELNYRRVQGVAPKTVNFHTFDLVKTTTHNLTDLTLMNRRELLEQFWALIRNNEHIKLIPIYEFETLDNVKRYYHKILEYGGEGIMLKNKASIYKEGKRPEHTWYKWKRYETIDAVIMGFTEGKGKYEGMIGAIEYGLWDGNRVKYVGNVSGIDDELRADITASPFSYLNKIMELGAHVRTENSLREPRFLRFRNDKSIRECTW